MAVVLRRLGPTAKLSTMIGELLLLSSFLVATPHAASPAQKPRTLPELVVLAMSEGKESPLTAGTAEALGLPKAETPRRKLRCRRQDSPDKKEHTFAVLYEDSKPTAVILSVATARGAGATMIADVYYHLASLDGTLRAVVRTSGLLDAVTSGDKIELDKAAKKRFSSEMRFHQRVVPNLGLIYVK